MRFELYTVGLALGALNGIVSGVVILLILKDSIVTRSRSRLSVIEKIVGRRHASGVKLAAKIATVPTVWYGGLFGAIRILNTPYWIIQLEDFVDAYWLSLGITFSAIVAFPVIRLIIRVGRDLGDK